jgi:hypothetical protein
MPQALKFCPVCGEVNNGCKADDDYASENGETSVILCRVGNPKSTYQLLSDDDWFLYRVDTKDIDFTGASGRSSRLKKSTSKPHTDTTFLRYIRAKSNISPSGRTATELAKRGLSLEDAADLGIKEITREYYHSWFVEMRNDQRNFPHNVLEGTLLPVRNVYGEIIHAQIRPFNLTPDFPKYLWATFHPQGGDPYRHPDTFDYYGRKPMNFIRGEAISDLCVVCEGVLKSFVVYSNLQKKYHVLSASGGNWTSNETYLKELKEGLRNLGVTKILLLPDSNSRANKDVWKSCEKLRVWAESNGFTFILGDWGHLDGKFDNQDPDEISPNQLNGIVQKFGKPRNPAELLAIKEVKRAFKPKLLVDKANNDLDFSDWVSRFTQSVTRFHLLNTPMGTGKSWLVEELHRNFDVNVIYISQSPRDLPTEYLARNAYVPPSRHDGLVNTGRRDPIGNLIYRRPKSKDEVPDTSASCLKAAEHALALKNGVPPAKLCRECPAFHGCLDGSDPDYTYLYDKIQGIKNHTLIATSVAGFSDKLIPDNGKETLIIVDECSQNMQPLEVIPLNSDEFTALDRRFTLIVDDGASSSGNLRYSQTGVSSNDRFIPLTAPTLVDVEDAERIDTQNLQNAMHGKGKASQYGKLVKGLMSKGYILDDGGLKLVCRSPQVSKILECTKATKVILMDATASKAVLEAELGISVEDYGAQDLSVNSVQIQVFLHPGASKFRITPEAFEFAKSIKKENWAILGACDLIGKDGIGFFRDSRGSNAAQEKDGLVIAGMPLPNLGGLKLKYSILETRTDSLSVDGDCKSPRPTITFNEYYQAHVQAELLQAIGRLRGYRRQGENLTVRIVCHTNLDWLQEYGYQVFYRAVPELTEKYTWLFQAQTEIPVSGYYRDSLSTPVTIQKSLRLGVLLKSNQDLNQKALEYGFTALGAFDKTFIPYKEKFLDVARKRLVESRSVCYS